MMWRQRMSCSTSYPQAKNYKQHNTDQKGFCNMHQFQLSSYQEEFYYCFQFRKPEWKEVSKITRT